MLESIVEVASYVSETEAMLALAFPGDYVSQALHTGQVNVLDSSDNWAGDGHGGSGNIHAEARTTDQDYSIDIIVRFPGFIKSSLAKIFSREPNAIVYTSVYCEGEK